MQTARCIDTFGPRRHHGVRARTTIVRVRSRSALAVLPRTRIVVLEHLLKRFAERRYDPEGELERRGVLLHQRVKSAPHGAVSF